MQKFKEPKVESLEKAQEEIALWRKAVHDFFAGLGEAGFVDAAKLASQRMPDAVAQAVLAETGSKIVVVLRRLKDKNEQLQSRKT